MSADRNYPSAAHARAVIWESLQELASIRRTNPRYGQLRSRIYWARKWLRERNEPGGYAYQDKTCGIRD